MVDEEERRGRMEVRARSDGQERGRIRSKEEEKRKRRNEKGTLKSKRQTTEKTTRDNFVFVVVGFHYT